MIAVRRCSDRSALAAFLLPVGVNNFKPELASLLTTEIIEAAIASWDIVEFFDTAKEVIVGVASREPNHHIHLYVDPGRRSSWQPHSSLQGMLDIFLSDCDRLYAAIPLTNKIALSLAHKMGFLHTGTKDGIASHMLTPQSRKNLLAEYQALQQKLKPHSD
jgi:hypothetical protein